MLCPLVVSVTILVPSKVVPLPKVHHGESIAKVCFLCRKALRLDSVGVNLVGVQANGRAPAHSPSHAVGQVPEQNQRSL